MAKRKNAAALALSRLGAKKGGAARAAKLTPAQRSESARKAVQARWARAKEGKDYIVVEEMGTKKVTFTDVSNTTAILHRIDTIVADDDQYQQDEVRPSGEIVDLAKKLIYAAEEAGVTRFPKTYVSVYYGEVDITWKTDRNMVRLIVRPNHTIELYRQRDYHLSPKGEFVPITVQDGARIAEQIHWLTRE